MNVEIATAETNSDGVVDLSPSSVSAGLSGPRSVPPLSIPRSQQYYWHLAWQEGERLCLADLEAGDYVEFRSDDPEDAARWLVDGE